MSGLHPPPPKVDSAVASDRFDVLDAIRFVAALWVAIFHLGLNHPEAFPFSSMRTVVASVFSGQMAVVAFFVISGLCIHFPTVARGGKLCVPAFLARRIVRIGVPFGVAVALGYVFSVPAWKLNLLSQSPLFWSLVCEIVYYAAYPMVLPLMRRFGSSRVLALSFLPALTAFLIAPRANWFQFSGDLLTAVFAYPSWLLGCVLAERQTRTRAKNRKGLRLFGARIGILGLSGLLALRQTHFAGKLPGTAYLLLLSAIPITFWIWVEIQSARPSPFARLLQIGGQWSYSIYLVHPAAYLLWDHFHPGCEPHSFAYLAGSILVMLLASFAFFLIVERPAINLAKLVSKRLLTASKAATAT